MMECYVVLSILIRTMIMCVQGLYICFVGYKLIFQYSSIKISQNATIMFATTCDCSHLRPNLKDL